MGTAVCHAVRGVRHEVKVWLGARALASRMHARRTLVEEVEEDERGAELEQRALPGALRAAPLAPLPL